MRNPVLITATAILIAGCVAAPAPPGPPKVAEPQLTGTEWTLVYFQSPEDSIGKVSPKPGEVYTLRLSPDGTMAAGLFCNRGTGHWSSPEAGAATGTISLNLVAVTQAACLPSPLERITADLARVRSFVIRDGRLHLNLMVDAGDYVWEPAR